MKIRRQLVLACIAGLVSGLLILGLGGRTLMRLLAFTTPEDPRFSWAGTLQIIALGGVWGTLTGPLVLLTRPRLENWFAGALFGLLVLLPAAVVFAIFSGFTGEIVAPASFLWLGAHTFPTLFMLHGLAVSSLVSRWRAVG